MMLFETLDTRFGPISIVWSEATQRVERIFLLNEKKNEKNQAAAALRATFPAAQKGEASFISDLMEKIERFLAGEAISFPLDIIALENCSPFQQRVLRTEYSVPRGRVTTYGRLAARLGISRGARAIGNALAANPFPLIIPCHRAVQCDGSLGGFQGGVKMKKALLEMEGVTVSSSQSDEKVVNAAWYY